MSNFSRLLLLLSNEVMIKSRDVVGPKVLSDPEQVCVCVYVILRIYVYIHVCMRVFDISSCQPFHEMKYLYSIHHV